MIKQALSIFFTLLLSSSLNLIQAQSQLIERTFEVNPSERIELNLKYGNTILIEAWDRPEVLFRATSEVNSGKLNDAVLIDFIQDDGLRVDMDFDSGKIKEGRAIDCPGKNYSYYNQYENAYRHVVCSEIAYEIFLPRNADLFVDTINANIELLGHHGPTSIKSISGFVDMSWQQRRGAELSIKTISGGVYSDLKDIQLLNRDEVAPVGQDIRAITGIGGVPVRLESISGDIFLRKGL